MVSRDFSPITRFLARRRVPLGFIAAVAALILARPTWGSWRAGAVVAIVGEVVRIWAAGHVEKGVELTRSGPYQWTAHPLYVGSSIIALGVILASRSLAVGVVAAVYMTATIVAAVRVEEAFLRKKFGEAYEQDRSGAEAVGKSFSIDRAVRNREYRGVIGLLIGFAFLAWRLVVQI